MVKGGSKMEGSSGRRMTSERLDVAEAPEWTMRDMGFSGETLGTLDTYHHLDEG